ncbi:MULTISPECIES: hypothetical protein [unclassified Streptomyces]|uniref:hypothetical protein n=1 Tax=unclassified Streptomyces TaxID=2593676 RepID=UPI000823949F|nr:MULTISPECIES: hypothetical protein [unclassified Streptomyces]SCK63086.1 hypothetical protein YUWDRAFT_06790 [Streptomyces sp. AmelKG-D3]
MSRLPDQPAPSAPWGPEVLEAVRATPAPLYAVALPDTAGHGWNISLLDGGGEVRDAFTATDLEEADRGLQQRGYLSMAAAMGRGWERLTPNRHESRHGTPVFRDPGEPL